MCNQFLPSLIVLGLSLRIAFLTLYIQIIRFSWLTTPCQDLITKGGRVSKRTLRGGHRGNNCEPDALPAHLQADGEYLSLEFIWMQCQYLQSS